jgi:hypothetical protein
MKYRNKPAPKTKQAPDKDRQFFGDAIKPFFFEGSSQPIKVSQPVTSGTLQTKPSPGPKKGKIVRVEVERSKFSRVPPGQGNYSADEYKAWQHNHPNAKAESRGLYNGGRDNRYPPNAFEALWAKGYYYARIDTDPDTVGSVVEVWLNDKGDGHQVFIYLKI